jgi:hypothetical protein
VAKPNRQAFDAKLATELWDRSERMISLSEGLIQAGCKPLAHRLPFPPDSEGAAMVSKTARLPTKGRRPDSILPGGMS